MENEEVFYSSLQRRFIQVGPERNCERPLDGITLLESVIKLIQSEYDDGKIYQPFLIDHVVVDFRTGIADIILRPNREDHGVRK
jgi:hypothetical protein